MASKPRQVNVTGNEDMLQIVRAILDMATHLWEVTNKFPKELVNEGHEDGIPDVLRVRPDVLRPAARVAIIAAGNNLEYAVSATTSEYRFARAKLLAWCAAEAEWEAMN